MNQSFKIQEKFPNGKLTNKKQNINIKLWELCVINSPMSPPSLPKCHKLIYGGTGCHTTAYYGKYDGSCNHQLFSGINK